MSNFVEMLKRGICIFYTIFIFYCFDNEANGMYDGRRQFGTQITRFNVLKGDLVWQPTEDWLYF